MSAHISRRLFEAIAAAAGLLILAAAGVTVAAAPFIPTGCSMAAFGLGLCIRRQSGAESSDYLQLSRVLLLSGGGLLALSIPFFHFGIMRPGSESLVHHVLAAFGGFFGLVLWWTFFCFIGFMFILASQRDPEPPA